mmetsp:Transcript_60182/g.189027  ORF Transcript_60182/g.189027 Transcript_60182/m.189027 type:complete len:344 (-) Transcript_60182:275-1306(-)
MKGNHARQTTVVGEGDPVVLALRGHVHRHAGTTAHGVGLDAVQLLGNREPAVSPTSHAEDALQTPDGLLAPENKVVLRQSHQNVEGLVDVVHSLLQSHAVAVVVVHHPAQGGLQLVDLHDVGVYGQRAGAHGLHARLNVLLRINCPLHHKFGVELQLAGIGVAPRVGDVQHPVRYWHFLRRLAESLPVLQLFHRIVCAPESLVKPVRVHLGLEGFGRVELYLEEHVAAWGTRRLQPEDVVDALVVVTARPEVLQLVGFHLLLLEPLRRSLDCCRVLLCWQQDRVAQCVGRAPHHAADVHLVVLARVQELHPLLVHHLPDLPEERLPALELVLQARQLAVELLL